MRRLPLLTVGMGRLNSRNSLYFSLLAGNLAGEGLAADCLLRQTVSTAEKVRYVAPEISEKGRLFAVLPSVWVSLTAGNTAPIAKTTVNRILVALIIPN